MDLIPDSHDVKKLKKTQVYSNLNVHFGLIPGLGLNSNSKSFWNQENLEISSNHWVFPVRVQGSKMPHWRRDAEFTVRRQRPAIQEGHPDAVAPRLVHEGDVTGGLGGKPQKSGRSSGTSKIVPYHIPKMCFSHVDGQMFFQIQDDLHFLWHTPPLGH